MHEFRVHTLVDITDNGSLAKQFPFKTPCGDVVHDRQTLATAKNQNSNFSTMLQLLQISGNIVWEQSPIRVSDTLGNSGFGRFYEGKHTSWHFQFFTEQTDVFGDPQNPTSELIENFHLVPIINFCKETATFPIQTFITKNTHNPALNQATTEQKVINALAGDIKNTYFSYAGFTNK